MPERQPTPAECANCGADIPKGAKACPECGADERTGWRETSMYDGLELPSAAWSDDTESRPAPPPRAVNGLPWYWWLVGVGLLLLIASAFILRR